MESVSERHVCLRPWQWSRRKSFIIIIIIISPSGGCLWQEIVLHRVSKTSLSPRFNPNPAYACRGMLVACVWPHPSWLLRTRVALVRPVTDELSAQEGILRQGSSDRAAQTVTTGSGFGRVGCKPAHIVNAQLEDFFFFLLRRLVGNSREARRTFYRVL